MKGLKITQLDLLYHSQDVCSAEETLDSTEIKTDKSWASLVCPPKEEVSFSCHSEQSR